MVIRSPLWCRCDANKAMFDKSYFGSMRTANFAVAGDTTQGVLWGLQRARVRASSTKGTRPRRDADDRHQNMNANNGSRNRGKAWARSSWRCGRTSPTRRSAAAIFPRGVPGDQVPNRIAENQPDHLEAG